MDIFIRLTNNSEPIQYINVNNGYIADDFYVIDIDSFKTHRYNIKNILKIEEIYLKGKGDDLPF